MNGALARAVNAEAVEAHRKWHAKHPGRAMPESQIRGAIGRGRAAFAKRFPADRVEATLGKLATTTTSASRRIARAALPVGLGDAVGALALDGPALLAVRAGRKLLRSVGRDYGAQVRRLLREGKTPSELRQALTERASVARSRADLIAIDQTHTLNARATQAIHRVAGSKSYVWRTQLDDDVRPEHQDREAVTFEWANKPSDGHPGEPIRCRCWAEPVIEE